MSTATTVDPIAIPITVDLTGFSRDLQKAERMAAESVSKVVRGSKYGFNSYVEAAANAGRADALARRIEQEGPKNTGPLDVLFRKMTPGWLRNQDSGALGVAASAFAADYATRRVSQGIGAVGDVARAIRGSQNPAEALRALEPTPVIGAAVSGGFALDTLGYNLGFSGTYAGDQAQAAKAEAMSSAATDSYYARRAALGKSSDEEQAVRGIMKKYESQMQQMSSAGLFGSTGEEEKAKEQLKGFRDAEIAAVQKAARSRKQLAEFNEISRIQAEKRNEMEAYESSLINEDIRQLRAKVIARKKEQQEIQRRAEAAVGLDKDINVMKMEAKAETPYEKFQAHSARIQREYEKNLDEAGWIGPNDPLRAKLREERDARIAIERREMLKQLGDSRKSAYTRAREAELRAAGKDVSADAYSLSRRYNEEIKKAGTDMERSSLRKARDAELKQLYMDAIISRRPKGEGQGFGAKDMMSFAQRDMSYMTLTSDKQKRVELQGKSLDYLKRIAENTQNNPAVAA